jgi:L-asparaginase
MLPTDWPVIAQSIAEIAPQVCGVVVLHGTDTLCYTASAVAFMLGRLEIPVFFTGANYPLLNENTDAVDNIEDCFKAIRSGELPRGVYVCFAGDIHIAAKARKVRFTGNCYESIDSSPLSQVYCGAISTNLDGRLEYYRSLCGSSQCPDEMKINPNVSLYKIYPGFDASILACDKSDAAILELYNNGTGPYGLDERYSLDKNIRKYGRPVFITSQQAGDVSMDTYGSSAAIADAGAVALGSMITETAVVKLMWLLGRGFAGDDLIKAMKADIRGEMICESFNYSEMI